MKARPHTMFRKSQHTITIDLPNDVFFDTMSLLKQINKAVAPYKLTGDDIVCMALEDFLETYIERSKALVNRITP